MAISEGCVGFLLSRIHKTNNYLIINGIFNRIVLKYGEYEIRISGKDVI